MILLSKICKARVSKDTFSYKLMVPYTTDYETHNITLQNIIRNTLKYKQYLLSGRMKSFSKEGKFIDGISI